MLLVLFQGGAKLDGPGSAVFHGGAVPRAFWISGVVLVSVMPRRKADAKRPSMHSNAKRWNEAARTWPE